MSKFGYSLSPSSGIDLDNIDKTKFNLLIEKERDILKCIACGSCTASCTSGKFTPTSLRSVILALQNGDDAKAYDLIKGCMLCGKCYMVCPRGINTRNLIISICQTYNFK